MTTDIDNGTDTNRRGRVSAATGKVRETASAARSKAGGAYQSARERTGAAYGSARERASSAYGTARAGASRATHRAADGIESNPVAALIGGFALGALIAAVLPKTRREEEVLGSTGRRLADSAREAARAARDAGTGKLDELGLNRDTAKKKLSELASQAGEAARSSAGAAAQTLKGGSQRP